ncbi:hypothetical protein CP532_3971 [Ophiocordyceps camponoti-leonardi (nom. inval.)]|nr:hypothetical protein CP532_3971 [Ophiocordyceps camponoti-leonardi (nom. inval.)]
MTVTEFALLQLEKGYDEEKLRQALARCRQRQDKWARLVIRSGSDDDDGSLSSMYLGLFDTSPTLLITAPWDSPEAHADWIRTEENQACNQELAEFVQSVELCHLEPTGREKAQLRGPFQPRGVPFSVHQLSVPDDRRDALAEACRALEETKEASTRDVMWAGWRLERDHGQSLVVFFTDDVGEEQQRSLIGSCQEAKHGRFRYVV